MRFLRGLLAALAVLLPIQAGAQALLQGGPFTAGRAPMYVGTGPQAVVLDSGPASGIGTNVGLSELLMVLRGANPTILPPYANAGSGPLNTNFCNYDGPLNSAAGYHYLCMSPNAQGGGLLTYNFVSPATALPFSFNINGVTSTVPASGIGSVTSVGLSMPGWFTVAGSPVTSTGTFAVTTNVQANNTVLAGPITGGPLAPSFRVLDITDIPTGYPAANLSGQVAVGNGGTGTNTLTAHGVLLGEGTSAIVATGVGGTGQILIGAAAADPAWHSTSGDASIASTGFITIANNAVTNAKAAQMATLTVKSNITGSTANASDNGLSAIIDAAIGNVQGDILYRGASAWNVLPPGTAGNCLQTGGAAANPSYGSCGSGGGISSIGLTMPSAFTVTGSPLVANGTLAVTYSGTAIPLANGGTGAAITGVSGGIPYYSSTTTEAASALLTANALVVGGGAGVAPSVVASLGTTTTLLHGNAAGKPTFSAVSLTADVTNTLPAANGGTAQATYTTGDILYASATNTLSKLPIGSSTNVLTVSGGVPAWSASSSGPLKMTVYQTFTTVGANAFAQPGGWPADQVFNFACWGGGGAGGASWGGGGGGYLPPQYAQLVNSLVSWPLTVTVGAGGTTTAQAGTASTIVDNNGMVLAGAGGGGSGASLNSGGGAPGTGGVAAGVGYDVRTTGALSNLGNNSNGVAATNYGGGAGANGAGSFTGGAAQWGGGGGGTTLNAGGASIHGGAGGVGSTNGGTQQGAVPGGGGGNGTNIAGGNGKCIAYIETN